MPETVSKWWGNIKDGNEWKESEVDLIASKSGFTDELAERKDVILIKEA